MCTLINKAGYKLWRLGKIFMQSLTLFSFCQFISSVSLPHFEGFEIDVFFTRFPHAN